MTWQCSNCGAPVGDAQVQFGIDNRPLGHCLNCSPKRAQLPEDDDHSAKAEERRRRIIKEHSTKAYRTVLRPLIPAGTFQRRTRPVEAEPLTMWDDSSM